MSKVEEKKPPVATNQAPHTLPSTTIDCSQAEKRLWLVKVGYNFKIKNKQSKNKLKVNV